MKKEGGRGGREGYRPTRTGRSASERVTSGPYAAPPLSPMPERLAPVSGPHSGPEDRQDSRATAGRGQTPAEPEPEPARPRASTGNKARQIARRPTGRARTDPAGRSRRIERRRQRGEARRTAPAEPEGEGEGISPRPIRAGAGPTARQIATGRATRSSQRPRRSQKARRSARRPIRRTRRPASRQQSRQPSEPGRRQPFLGQGRRPDQDQPTARQRPAAQGRGQGRRIAD